MSRRRSVISAAHPIFVPCLLVAVLCLAADSWVLRENGIGPVKVGMSRAQLSAVLHDEFIEGPSSNDSCSYVHARGNDRLWFMLIDGKLVRVDVNGPGIKTSTGIQVGDSEASVRGVYGNKVEVSPDTYTDTGHYLTVRSPDGVYGTRFETDNGKVTSFYAGKYEAIQYVERCL
jgi:hypothetical protein